MIKSIYLMVINGYSLIDIYKVIDNIEAAIKKYKLKSDERNGVYLAIQQMIVKGAVTVEESRRLII